MNDLVMYCQDFNLFLTELKEKFPQFVNEEAERREDMILVDKTPVHWKGDAFVCRIRIDFTLDSGLTTAEMVEEDDPRVTAIYPRTPATYTDEEGNEYTYTPPPIGSFA